MWAVVVVAVAAESVNPTDGNWLVGTWEGDQVPSAPEGEGSGRSRWREQYPSRSRANPQKSK